VETNSLTIEATAAQVIPSVTELPASVFVTVWTASIKRFSSERDHLPIRKRNYL